MPAEALAQAAQAAPAVQAAPTATAAETGTSPSSRRRKGAVALALLAGGLGYMAYSMSATTA